LAIHAILARRPGPPNHDDSDENMTFAPRLLPLALTLLSLSLSLSIQSACAAGAGSREPYSASPLTAGATLASQYAWRAIRQPDGPPAGAWSAGTSAPNIGGRGIGIGHDLGGAMRLNLHVGDGRAAGNEGMDWRDLKAGLSRKFEGGWSLSGTYSRAFGAAAAGAFERYASAMSRTDPGRPQGSKSGRGAIVLSLNRRF